MAVGVNPDEVRRIQEIRKEWTRFRKMMKGPKPRGIRVGELRKKARQKEARRDFLALEAFARWCNFR